MNLFVRGVSNMCTCHDMLMYFAVEVDVVYAKKGEYRHTPHATLRKKAEKNERPPFACMESNFLTISLIVCVYACI